EEEDAKSSAGTTDIFHFRQVSPRSAKAVGKLSAVNSNSLRPDPRLTVPTSGKLP
ncbi:hypothetical protein AVEN_135975-1, partial [Araneus ventricosus]